MAEPKSYRWSFDSRVLTEPANWSDFIPERAPNAVYKLPLAQYSRKVLVLVKDAKNYIDGLYATDGAAASCRVYCDERTQASKGYERKLTGQLNFSRIKVGRLTTEIQFESEDFIQRLLNSDEIETSLQELTDLEGNALAYFDDYEHNYISLGPIPIDKKYTAAIDPFDRLLLEPEGETSATVYGQFTPTIVSDSNTLNLIDFNIPLAVQASEPSANYAVQADGEVLITLAASAGILLIGGYDHGANQAFAQWYYRINDNPAQALGASVLFPTSSGTNAEQTLTFNGTFSAGELSKDDQIAIFIKVENLTGPSRTTNVYILIDESYQMTIKQATKTSTVTAPGMLAWEYLLRLCQKVTGRQDALRSAFFGRTDGEVHPYDEDGPGAGLWISRVERLRGFPLADQPLVDSLQRAFVLFDGLYNLGLGITYESDTPYIRIDPIADFYPEDVVLALSDPADLEVVPDETLIFSSLSCGFSQYAAEEPGIPKGSHTVRTYSVEPLTKKTPNAYDIKVDAVANGQTLEYIKADRYSADDPRDNKFDGARVLIEVYRVAGTIWAPLRGDALTAVTGSDYPDELYNLTITPVRCMIRHLNTVTSGLAKHYRNTATDVSVLFRYQTGVGNVSLATQTSEETAEQAVAEKQNFTKDLVAAPIWDGDLVTFEIALTRAQEVALDTPGRITITDRGTTYTGTLYSVRNTDLIKRVFTITLRRVYTP